MRRPHCGWPIKSCRTTNVTMRANAQTRAAPKRRGVGVGCASASGSGHCPPSQCAPTSRLEPPTSGAESGWAARQQVEAGIARRHNARQCPDSSRPQAARSRVGCASASGSGRCPPSQCAPMFRLEPPPSGAESGWATRQQVEAGTARRHNAPQCPDSKRLKAAWSRA